MIRGRVSPGPRVLAVAATGTAVAVGGLEFAAIWREQPYPLIPFVTSIALVMGAPDAEASRPRALIGGHVLCTVVGYLFLALFGSSPWIAAIAAGAAVATMLATRTFHPPAGIDPFLVVNDALGPAFLLGTVLPGSLALAAFAALWRRLGRRLGIGASAGGP